MTNEERIMEIDNELFLLEMKDRFDDSDWALKDRLTAERNALEKAGNKPAIESIKEVKEVVKPMEETKTGVSLIENVEIEVFTQTMDKITRFQSLIKSQLTVNHDYGIIPGTKKPTLLKPGAEKILMLMGLTIEDMDLNRTSKPEPVIQVINGETDLITLKQAKRMIAISKGNVDLCRKVCARYGYKVSTEIKKADYDGICAEIEKATRVA